jgi:hypothetical protein
MSLGSEVRVFLAVSGHCLFQIYQRLLRRIPEKTNGLDIENRSD